MAKTTLPEQKNHVMGHLKIISAILIWSSLGIFVRNSGLPNTAIIFYQSLIAGALQCIVLSATVGLRRAGGSECSTHSALLLALLPLCLIANMFFFYYAFTHTTIANALLTHYTAPVFVALTAPFFLREKTFRRTWITIILSSIGLWFILKASADIGPISPKGRDLHGSVAGVISGLAYALIILIMRGIADRFSSLFIVFIQNGIISLLLLPFVISIPLTAHSLLSVVAMGVLHSTIAPMLYCQGFKSVKATEAAILGYLEPVGAIILALIFLNEVPGINTIIGGALIVFSGLLIVIKRTD